MFLATNASDWVQAELQREDRIDLLPAAASSRPVSVRLDHSVIAFLDAFAGRFGSTRSGMLLRLVKGGLQDAIAVLPPEEDERICALAKKKAAEAGWDLEIGEYGASIRGPIEESAGD